MLRRMAYRLLLDAVALLTRVAARLEPGANDAGPNDAGAGPTRRAQQTALALDSQAFARTRVNRCAQYHAR
jgi:hypothetical protein